VILLENIKRLAEKATGWRRPDDAQVLVRGRKPQTYFFGVDGMTASFPIIRDGRSSSTRARWFGRLSPSTPRRCLKSCLAAMAGETRGATASTTTSIIIRASMKSLASRGEAVRCDLEEKADVLSASKPVTSPILPAGTGHQRIKASDDFLVVGAYPASGAYDECKSREDREKSLAAIDRVARPRRDPVYGKDDPLMHIWAPRSRRPSRTG
jgi:hypothetical protein